MPTSVGSAIDVADTGRTLRRDRLLALLVTACVLIATVTAWAIFRSREDDDAFRDRERQADSLIGSLSAGYAQTQAVLSSANALVDSNGTIDARRLETFAKVVLAPGLASTLAYEPIVTDANRAQFEAQLGAPIVDRDAAGNFVRAPSRPIYYPVAAVQAADPNVQPALGFDIARDPERGETLRVAGERGEAHVTPVLELAPTNRPGFLIVQPLRPADGRVVGFLTVSYVGEAVGASILAGLPPDTRIRVVDDGDELFRSADPPAGAIVRALPIGGRTWQMTIELPSATSRTASTAVLATGLALTALAALVAMLSLRHHQELLNGRHQIAAERDLAALLAVAVTRAEVVKTAADTIPSLAPAKAASIGIIEGQVMQIQHSPTLDESTRERWASIPLRERTPFTDTARNGRAIVFDSIESLRREYPDVELDDLSAARALVCQPLVVGPQVIGAIAFGFSRAQTFDDDQLRWLAQIAAMVAGALERARLYDTQEQVALTLQRDLLPSALPDDSNYALSAAYRPGVAVALVGGDWYDAFKLADGRLAITIGDVAGKGVRAAASMGKMRHVLRACAGAYQEPALVVTHANRLICEGSREVFATACYLTIDVDGECRFALAGHPPPLVTGRRLSRLIEAAAGAPLGVSASSHYHEANFRLADDERIVLYTDGLVERRDENIDRSLERLVTVAHRIQATDADALATAMAESPLDDVVVLVVQRKTHRIDDPAPGRDDAVDTPETRRPQPVRLS